MRLHMFIKSDTLFSFGNELVCGMTKLLGIVVHRVITLPSVPDVFEKKERNYRKMLRVTSTL